MGKHFYIRSFTDSLFLFFSANEVDFVLISSNMRKAPKFTRKYVFSRIVVSLTLFVRQSNTETEKQFKNIKREMP